MIHFTGDTHFGHRLFTHMEENGIGLRPYDYLEDMHADIIEVWNEHVKPTDTVYHLGDFGLMDPRECMKIREQLNGSICVLRGNHSSCETRMAKEGAFEWIKDLYTLVTRVGDEQLHIELCHYPIESWKNRQHGAIHLHGHCHNMLRQKDPRRLDVGWDTMGRPFSLVEILHLCHSELTQVDGHNPGDTHG